MIAAHSKKLVFFVIVFGWCVWSVSPQPVLAQDSDGNEVETSSGSPSADDEKEALPTIASKAAGLSPAEGFFTFYWDERRGKIWLVVDRWTEFLYVQSLATGLGSNPVGLDRGQLGRDRVVRFRRVGPRVFLEHLNLKYRATSDNVAEQRAVQESFASSVIGSFEIAAEDAADRVLIDFTPFVMSDAHNVVGTLKSSGQGAYSLDRERCYLYEPRCKAFPQNTEFEAALTFTTQDPGALVVQTAASPESVTLRQHFSLIQLPEVPYQPRRADPRVGTFNLSYADYSTDIGQPLWQYWVNRHRLNKKFLDQEPSPPVEPIVYYVDSGAPPKIRQALIEGASWWNAAFESAGYIDAFQVRELPPGVDPMDVRYNVIQWVHRSTRGWSYGQSVTDPRTGEILKGHVLLGSLRVHQDHLLIRGLGDGTNGAINQACECCGQAASVFGVAAGQLQEGGLAEEVALARIRQLSAHEVGHTLGFSHNFAASTYDDRASVMDYPAPRININDQGQLDFSDAYGVGVGSWDHFVVNYAYRDFRSEENESDRLNKLVEQSIADGHRYISDADSRPMGAAHPAASLWDNGSDSVAQLKHELRVRDHALEQLKTKALPAGRPRSEFEMMFVPIYLHHRYQVEATAKMIGGVNYNYGVAGDSLPNASQVSVPEQQAALAVLLEAIAVERLTIAPELIERLVPKSQSSPQDRERFSGRTSPHFDALAAAEVAAELVIHQVLQPERLARLESNASEDWSCDVVMRRVIQATWGAKDSESERAAVVQRVVQMVTLRRLIQLGEQAGASDAVRGHAEYAIRRLETRMRLQRREATKPGQISHLDYAIGLSTRFLNRERAAGASVTSPATPPGSPIGN